VTDTQQSKQVLTNTTSFFTKLTEHYQYAVFWRSETQTRGPPHYHKLWINRDEHNPPRPTVRRLNMGCCVSPAYFTLWLLLESKIDSIAHIFTDDIVRETTSHHTRQNTPSTNRPGSVGILNKLSMITCWIYILLLKMIMCLQRYCVYIKGKSV